MSKDKWASVNIMQDCENCTAMNQSVALVVSMQYKDGKLIDPLKLFWSKVKNDETCDVEEVFKSAV